MDGKILNLLLLLSCRIIMQSFQILDMQKMGQQATIHTCPPVSWEHKAMLLRNIWQQVIHITFFMCRLLFLEDTLSLRKKDQSIPEYTGHISDYPKLLKLTSISLSSTSFTTTEEYAGNIN